MYGFEFYRSSVRNAYFTRAYKVSCLSRHTICEVLKAKNIVFIPSRVTVLENNDSNNYVILYTMKS